MHCALCWRECRRRCKTGQERDRHRVTKIHTEVIREEHRHTGTKRIRKDMERERDEESERRMRKKVIQIHKRKSWREREIHIKRRGVTE